METQEPVLFCKKCGKNQPESQFYKSKTSSKYVFPCKDCKRNYYRTWTKTNPDYHKKWKTTNKDKVSQHNKTYRKKRRISEDQD